MYISTDFYSIQLYANLDFSKKDCWNIILKCIFVCFPYTMYPYILPKSRLCRDFVVVNATGLSTCKYLLEEKNTNQSREPVPNERHRFTSNFTGHISCWIGAGSSVWSLRLQSNATMWFSSLHHYMNRQTMPYNYNCVGSKCHPLNLTGKTDDFTKIMHVTWTISQR